MCAQYETSRGWQYLTEFNWRCVVQIVQTLLNCDQSARCRRKHTVSDSGAPRTNLRDAIHSTKHPLVLEADSSPSECTDRIPCPQLPPHG